MSPTQPRLFLQSSPSFFSLQYSTSWLKFAICSD
ncbi:unnamed protein product, partial [Vitis vinifera]